MVRPHLATLVDDFRRHGKEIAIVVHSGNRRQATSYAELADLAERFAAELMRREVGAGERVVLWGQNSAEWIGAFFGCVLRGVLVVPLDAHGETDFAQRVVAETRPRLIVGDEALISRLASAVPRIALGGLGETLGAVPTLASAVPSRAALREASLGPDTPLQILFTSGTTSEPKGVVHTHGNVLASLEPIEREMQKYLRYERIFHPLRFLHTLPLSHVFGQFMGLWIPPLLAAEVHFEERLQAPRLLELIRRYRISVLAAVPRVLDLLKSHLESKFHWLPERLESARGERVWSHWWKFRDVHREFGFKFWAFVCGGASLAPELERFWNDLGFALIQGYGMTETAALITLNHPFHIGRGTIGKPLPGREIRIAQDGEVLVRGEMVATTQWRNGEMQKRPDPWLPTGDLVEQDKEGQLRFLGRKSEIIVTAAGLNIHPEDVEAALNRQPGVEASAVVPIETAAGTEAVAVLIFRGGAEQAQGAIDAANVSLAEYQRIRRWRIWPELDFPRTSTGKIRRQRLTQWVAAQEAAERVGKDSSSAREGDPLSDLIAEITRSRPARIDDEARLDRDMNLDSLGRVQLQTELEQRLGVSIRDEEFEQITTLGQLRARLGFEAGQSNGLDGNRLEGNGLDAVRAERQRSGTTVQARKISREPEYVYPRWAWWTAVYAIRVLFEEAVMRPLVWLLAAPTVTRSTAGSRAPKQPVLLIANHVTAYDAALILYALPSAMRRKVAIAMSGEVLEDLRHGRKQGSWFRNLLAPVGYWLITALFNVFPLPRSAGFRRSFAHAGEAMDRGYHLLVFPEGKRSEDGRLQPFRAGIGLLAQESKAEILPIALKGLGELKQRKRSWFRSNALQIRIGELLTVDTQMAPEQIADSLRAAVAELLREPQPDLG
jgi:long-chain acyl-CoA synthetase